MCSTVVLDSGLWTNNENKNVAALDPPSGLERWKMSKRAVSILTLRTPMPYILVLLNGKTASEAV